MAIDPLAQIRTAVQSAPPIQQAPNTFNPATRTITPTVPTFQSSTSTTPVGTPLSDPRNTAGFTPTPAVQTFVAPAYQNPNPNGVTMPTLTPEQQKSQNDLNTFNANFDNLDEHGKPMGSVPTSPTGGNNQQNLVEQMRGMGLTDAQIRANLANPAFKTSLQSGKIQGKFDANGNYLPSATEQLADLPAKRAAAIAGEQAAGGSGQSAADRFNTLETTLRQQAANETANTTANNQAKLDQNVQSTAGGEPITSTTNPTGGSTPQKIDTTGITDPAQLALANAQNGIIDAISQNQSGDNSTALAALAALKQTYDQQDQIIQQGNTEAMFTEADQQRNLDEQKRIDQQAAIDNAKAARADLVYQEQQSLRQASIDKGKATMDVIAKLAMTGGTGSTGGLADITAVNDKYEQAMQDIKDKFQVDATDLAVKFTGIFVKAQDDWTTATNTNIKDTNALLQTNRNQSLASKTARNTAEQKIYSDWQTQQDKNNTDMANAKMAGVKEMNAMATAQQDRTDKITQQTQDNNFKQQTIDNAKQASIDAALARGDTKAATAAQRDLAEGDKWFANGQTMQKDFKASLASKTESPLLGTYNDFNILYGRWTATNKVDPNDMNSSISVLKQDLFANANNPKLSSRMPAQTVTLITDNLSILQKIQGEYGKQMGEGGMPKDVLKNMNDAMAAIHTGTQQAAQQEVGGWILDAIHQNMKMPAAYRDQGIDHSTITAVVGEDLVSGAFQALANTKGISDATKNQMINEDLGNEATPAPDTGTSGGSTALNSKSTLTDMMGVYAPKADGNDPVGYAQDIASKVGITADTPIGTLVDKVPQIAQAIADHEGFTNGSSRYAVENNNPGNLKFIGQVGARMGSGGFAKFPTVEAGRHALQNDLLAKIGRGGTADVASTTPSITAPESYYKNKSSNIASL